MSDAVGRESPLVQRYVSARRPNPRKEPSVRLSERSFDVHLNLRGDPTDAGFLQAVEGVIGVALPLVPNRVTDTGSLAAFWLGPDEWLLVTLPARETVLADQLGRALEGLFTSVTDVSSGQTVINLSGEHCRDVLAKGCTLDLHPRVFGPGQCAQTLLAKAGALIRPLDDTPSFDVIVRRSFAEYVWLWLDDAANEYGLAYGGAGAENG